MSKEEAKRAVALLLEGLCHEVANTMGATLAFLELAFGLDSKPGSREISALYSKSQQLVERLKRLRRLLDDREQERTLQELFGNEEVETGAELLSSRVKVWEALLRFALKRLRDVSGSRNKIRLLASSNGFVLAEIKLPSKNLFKDKALKLENYDLFFALQLLGAKLTEQGEEAPCRLQLMLKRAD